MRDLSKMTTAEADAYRLGYQDGRAAWAAERRLNTGPHIECKSANPDVQCRQCNCWKMTRELCS